MPPWFPISGILLFLILSDLYIYAASAVSGGSFHYKSYGPCNFTVLTDDFAHIILCNAQNQNDIISVLFLRYFHFLRMINDAARDIG